MTMTRTFPLLLAVLALPAGAQTIYRCTDAGGGTLISNARLDKSCKPVQQTPDSSLPAPKAKPGATTATPGSFPKVPEDAQKARDTDRRRILEQELAGEQRNLDQARRDLVEQSALRPGEERNGAGGFERLQPYRDRVTQHERNIEAIQKELANLR